MEPGHGKDPGIETIFYHSVIRKKWGSPVTVPSANAKTPIIFFLDTQIMS
jgi:hypothetical protein